MWAIKFSNPSNILPIAPYYTSQINNLEGAFFGPFPIHLSMEYGHKTATASFMMDSNKSLSSLNKIAQNAMKMSNYQKVAFISIFRTRILFVLCC